MEFADTLSHECDYLVLLSIYGQMADVFRMQYLHQEAIKAFQKYSYYSFRANKTDEYIRGIAFMAPDFDKMCTYKITYPNFQAFSKNNLCKWVTQRLFFVSLHHVCT